MTVAAFARQGVRGMVGPMIETCLILFLLVVIGFFVGARLMAQNARKDPVAARARLHQSLAWHEERLRAAKEKNWDYEMIKRISDQIDDTRFELAQLANPPRK